MKLSGVEMKLSDPGPYEIKQIRVAFQDPREAVFQHPPD